MHECDGQRSEVLHTSQRGLNIFMESTEPKPKRRAIQHGLDGRGRKIALVYNGDDTYTLLVRAENYAGHVRGGIASTWRWFGPSQRMPRDEAEILFQRRIKTP